MASLAPTQPGVAHPITGWRADWAADEAPGAGAPDLEALKRQIRVHQRRRKRRLWLGGVPVALATLVVGTVWQLDGPVDTVLEGLGIALIVLGGLGRAWSILYIGGRKTRELVQDGPYSLTRNPLYLFTLVAAVGLGLQTGSMVTGLAYSLATLAVFLPVIRAEEAAMAERFGAVFSAYRRAVPRLMPRLVPRPGQWHDVGSLQIAPAQLYRSLRDSALVVALIPLYDGVEWLQVHHVLPVLLRLP